MRYFETVTVNQPAGQGAFDMPAHLAWEESVTQPEALAPFRIVSRLRMVFPPEFTVPAGSQVVWRGDTWKLDGSAMLHTRRGEPHHHSATLERITG